MTPTKIPENTMAVVAVETVPGLPEITTHPQSQTAVAGTSVILEVVAGPLPLDYQWYHDDVAIPGNDESHQVLWVALADVPRFNNNRSTLRMVEKTRRLQPAAH